MRQYVLYSGFKCLNWKEIDKFDLNSISKNRSHAYILEVDLEYPDELHELQNAYTLAPEKLEINCQMLSKYCSDIADEYGIKDGGANKLIPNLVTIN